MILNQRTALDEAFAIDTDLDNLVKMTVLQIGSIRRRIFENPSYTPAEIFAAYGTNARKLVELYYELTVLVNSAAPGSIDAAASAELIVNADGSVTITELVDEYGAAA